MITLTHKQNKWLEERNRDEKDVYLDDEGLFIEMKSWSKLWKDVPIIKKIYLPK